MERLRPPLLKISEHQIKFFVGSEKIFDYKTQLQEYTQAKLSCIPEYRLIAENGPEHERIFNVQLQVNGSSIGYGQGKSKKEAEQAAAKQGFEKLLSSA